MTKGGNEFRAAGYAGPVCGVIYGSADTVTNGMPLGTIDTGCLDLESNGTFGYCTIFNTHTPQRGGSAVRMPALALAVGGKTWALCREAAPATPPMMLPHVAEWLPADIGPGQPAWAVHATGVPGWAKSRGIGVCDIPQAACSVTTRPCCAGPVRCAPGGDPRWLVGLPEHWSRAEMANCGATACA